MLKKAALDRIAAAGCQNPDCQHKDHQHGAIFLHGNCHPRADVSASYVAGSGVLVIKCAQCGKMITQVAVAEELYS